MCSYKTLKIKWKKWPNYVWLLNIKNLNEKSGQIMCGYKNIKN